MKPHTLKKAIKYFEECAPNEGCAFILKTGVAGHGEKFISIENKIASEAGEQLVNHKDGPNLSFLIEPQVYIKHSRNIKYIVHSHVYDGELGEDEPSIADIMHQKATAVPWIIFVIHNGKYTKHYYFGARGLYYAQDT